MQRADQYCHKHAHIALVILGMSPHKYTANRHQLWHKERLGRNDGHTDDLVDHIG